MKKFLLAFALLGLATAAFAKSKPEQDYPLTGTVVSFHNQQEVRGSGSGGDVQMGTFERRVYVVKTSSGTLEISGWDSTRGFMGHSKDSKRPPLSIGQTLTYHTDGKFIYTVLEDGKEHRYAIFAAD